MKKPNEYEKLLAVNGGEKAKPTPNPSGLPGASVLGEDELEEILDLFNVRGANKTRIIRILKKEPQRPIPHLFRYYAPGGKESKVRQFEKEFANKIGTKYALGVNSCTSALIASLVSAGIGPGDEVIVPGYTFFASCASIVAAKAIPVIAEVDKSLTLDPNELENKITDQTKGVIPVHMRGMPCRMDDIMEIAKDHNLKVIEDVAQACGGSYKGKRLGSIGDLGCFSLDYFKIITSGEGGVITTDNEFLYNRAQSYHDTAACWRPDRYARERFEGELFCAENYRMSELQGALALAQLRKLDGLIGKMRKNKAMVKNSIQNIGGIEFRDVPDAEGDTAVCLIFYLPDVKTTKKFIPALQAEGIEAGGLYDKTIRDWHIYSNWEHILEQKTATQEGCPYRCPYYKGNLPEYSTDMCPKTLDLLSRTVHITISPHLTEEDCSMIAKGIKKVANAYLSNI